MKNSVSPKKSIAAFMALALTLAPAVCCCIGIAAESTSASLASVSNVEMGGHHHHPSKEDPSSKTADSTHDCGDCQGSDCFDCVATKPHEETRHDPFTSSTTFKFELVAVVETQVESWGNLTHWIDSARPLRGPPPFLRETPVSLFSLLLI